MDLEEESKLSVLWSVITAPMFWLINLVLPPLRYWTIYHNGHKRIITIKQRFHPGVEKNFDTMGVITLDGPHKTQDEAARRLAFWQAQYRREGISRWK